MVIGENFDRSLWLILFGDKICRNDIANLIYNIPSEIFSRIHQEIDKYNYDDYDIDVDFDFVKIKKVIRNLYNEMVMYDIEINSDEIKIKLTKWKDNVDRVEEYYELTLFPVSMKRLESEDYIDIGKYYHKKSGIVSIMDTFVVTVSGIDREYCLENNLLFGLIMRTNEDGRYFKRINLDKISSIMEIEDLKDNQSISRLIRTKKMR